MSIASQDQPEHERVELLDHEVEISTAMLSDLEVWWHADIERRVRNSIKED